MNHRFVCHRLFGMERFKFLICFEACIPFKDDGIQWVYRDKVPKGLKRISPWPRINSCHFYVVRSVFADCMLSKRSSSLHEYVNIRSRKFCSPLLHEKPFDLKVLAYCKILSCVTWIRKIVVVLSEILYGVVGWPFGRILSLTLNYALFYRWNFETLAFLIWVDNEVSSIKRNWQFWKFFKMRICQTIKRAIIGCVRITNRILKALPKTIASVFSLNEKWPQHFFFKIKSEMYNLKKKSYRTFSS